MAITAKTSHKLHQILGDEAAEDVVNWMQQADSKRTELRELNDLNFARLDTHFVAFEARFDAFEARMDAKFERRFGELTASIEHRLGEADTRLERRLGEFEAKLERRFSDLLKWSFVFWIGAVGVVVLTRLWR